MTILTRRASSLFASSYFGCAVVNFNVFPILVRARWRDSLLGMRSASIRASEAALFHRSKRKVARQFDLKTVGRSFKACACALIVDDEEIAVRSIDVTKAHVDNRQASGGVELD